MVSHIHSAATCAEGKGSRASHADMMPMIVPATPAATMSSGTEWSLR